MSHYWARFVKQGGAVMRFDTRIYIQACAEPRPRDRAIGAIIGKNPGSALPTIISGRLQALSLQGDHFLPSVLSIVSKAYQGAGIVPRAGAYVRVLNLFYLCNRDLKQAKTGLRTTATQRFCKEESKSVPWTWFAWGGDDSALNPLKARFLKAPRKHSFYYCNSARSVKTCAPGVINKARHTQGMPHGAVVQHLAGHLQNKANAETRAKA